MNLRKHLFLYFYAIVLTVLTVPHAVYADDPAFWGEVTPPPYIAGWLTAADGSGAGALVLILNMLLRLVLVLAGFFALWKFIEAGYVLINSSGDPKKMGEARDKIMLTIVGIVVVAGSLVIAALVGIIFFGSPSALLQPTLTGAPPAP